MAGRPWAGPRRRPFAAAGGLAAWLWGAALVGWCGACGVGGGTVGPGANANANDVADGAGASGGNVTTPASGGDGNASGGGTGGDGNASGGGTGGDGNAVAAAPTLGQRYDVVGIVGTGQSLSVGVAGNYCSLDYEPAFDHVKLADAAGVWALSDPNAPSLYLLPLTEPLRPFYATGIDTYPHNLYGVTQHTALAHQLSALSMAHRQVDYPTAATVVGESGRSITTIRPHGVELDNSNSPSFAAALYETQAIGRLLAEQNRTYAVGAVTLVHGEADWARASYGNDIVALQQAFDANLRAITQQTDPILLYATQQHTLGPGRDAATPLAAASYAWSRYGIWRAAIDHPDALVLVGPKYQWPYAGDFLHMVQAGYHAVGEKTAQAFYQTTELGAHFWPTMPLFVTQRDATHLELPYHAPVPPLNFDEGLPANAPGQAQHASGSRYAAWAAGRGFEVLDGAGTPLTIAAADVDPNGTSVVLTMAAALPSTVVVQYAMTQDNNTSVMGGGAAGGFMGQLRDSDPFAPLGRNTAYCTLTTNSNVLTCATSLWFANVYTQLWDPNGAPLGYAVSPTNTNWTQWSLLAPWSGPTQTLPITFAPRMENYGVSFALVGLWQRVGAGAAAPMAVYAAGEEGENDLGACLVRQGSTYVAGSYRAATGTCQGWGAQGLVAATSFELLRAPGSKAVDWRAASGGAAGDNAVLVDVDAAGVPSYVCRVQHGSDTLVGTLWPAGVTQSGCVAATATGEKVASASYEVLVAPTPTL